MANAAKPISIIKKKVGHGGHHGGAWKVAYADFVTAMMALFIVLWLLNTSKPVKEAIAGYFKDPSGSGQKTGTSMTGTGEALTVSKDNMDQLKSELQKSMAQMKDFDKLKNQVEMTVTQEGLRIELLEAESSTFFDLGSSRPTEKGQELMDKLAEELGKLPNKISIEGHTDAKPYVKNREYGNWELSTDRANAARRLMQTKGIRADQVSQVRGYADQKLRKPDAPLDASNRRISVIVHYLEKQAGSEDEEYGEKHEESGKQAEVEPKPKVEGESKPGAEGGEKEH
jgi:chemotaxis protein MotB